MDLPFKPVTQTTTFADNLRDLIGWTIGDYEGIHRYPIILYTVWRDYFFDAKRAKVLQVEEDFALVQFWTEGNPQTLRTAAIPLKLLCYNHYIR